MRKEPITSLKIRRRLTARPRSLPLSEAVWDAAQVGADGAPSDYHPGVIAHVWSTSEPSAGGADGGTAVVTPSPSPSVDVRFDDGYTRPRVPLSQVQSRDGVFFFTYGSGF